jgi:hypothetical protein
MVFALADSSTSHSAASTFYSQSFANIYSDGFVTSGVGLPISKASRRRCRSSSSRIFPLCADFEELLTAYDFEANDSKYREFVAYIRTRLATGPVEKIVVFSFYRGP